MELRHLRYFVAVAEELHFTRAAQRVGIGQPPLSQQIRDLEREIGVTLFDRRTRSVDLTAAGAVFLDDAREILAAADRAKTKAARAAAGQIGSLRVGFTASAAFNPLVPATIRRYREIYAEVELSLREANSWTLGRELLDGTLDVAFLRGAPSDAGEMVVQELAREPLVAVFPDSLRFAGAGAIPLAILANQPFVLFPRANGPEVHDAILASCRAVGFEPFLAQEAPQLTTIVNLVAAGMGVSLVPSSMAQVKVTGVEFRPLLGKGPFASVLVARRAEDNSPTVARFMAQARRAPASAPSMPG